MLDKNASITLVISDPALRNDWNERAIEDSEAVPFPSEDTPFRPGDGMLVVVDQEHASRQAASLVGSGIAEERVRWLDASTVREGLAALLATACPADIRARGRLPGDDGAVIALADHYESPEQARRYDPGYDFLRPHVRWRRNELVIVAGPYGCGKSTVSQSLALKLAMGDLCSDSEVAAWFCTMEDDPGEQLRQIQRHVRYAHFDQCGRRDFDAEREIVRLARRIHVTRPQWSGEKHMDWWDGQVRRMHRAYGTNVHIIDPWGEMDHQMAHRETETQYVKTVMRRCRRLVDELGVIIMVVTHIGKDSYARDGRIEQFRIAHAMGSVNFGGSADRGFCVTRTDQLVGYGEHTILHFDKIKIEGSEESGMGVKGTLALRYERKSHEFFRDPEASAQATDAWKRGGKLDDGAGGKRDDGAGGKRDWGGV